jgi:hypothetical protein
VAAITPGPSNIMLTAAGVLRGLPCLLGVVTGMGAMVRGGAAGTFLSADGGSAIVQSAVLGGLFIVGALLALSIVLIV